MKRVYLVLSLFVLAVSAQSFHAMGAVVVSEIQVWGEEADMTPGVTGSVSNLNRLGGFGSSISYDATNHILWAIPDRGPGDGSLSFEAKMQKFQLDVNPATGELSNFALLDTIRFKTSDGTQNFNGQLQPDPQRTLDLSVDPEGLVVTPDGKVYFAEEYGPSIYEFELVDNGGVTEAWQTSKVFTVPDRYIPTDDTGQPNYTSSDLVSGRQSGRGFESLTMTPDGTKLYAAMQCPLTQEGGRNSRNIRIAEFDVATGACTAEYIYQVESIEDINARIPDEYDAEFKANQQGRNITPNELFALNDHELLVVERDNRGIGTGNPTNTEDPAAAHPGTKRVYHIDLTGATDVSGIDLLSDGSLPDGVVPVNKDPDPVVDMIQILNEAGMPIPEKIEGISMIPLTGINPFALLLAVDNDFSVIDIEDEVTGEVNFFDVCTDGTMIPLDDPLPEGVHLLPSRLYSVVVPEPGTFTLLAGFFAMLGVSALIRRSIRHNA